MDNTTRKQKFLEAIKHGHTTIASQHMDEDLHYHNKNSSEACTLAATHGQLASLKYLHEIGFKWDEETMLAAAKAGSSNCLIYLYEQGCKRTEDVIRVLEERGDIHNLKYISKERV